MPPWVLEFVPQWIYTLFGGHPHEPSVGETNALIQQPGEVEQKPGCKRGKKQRDRKKNRMAQPKEKEHEQQTAEAQRSRLQQLEEQGDEKLQQLNINGDEKLRKTVTAPTQQREKKDPHFNHPLRTKLMDGADELMDGEDEDGADDLMDGADRVATAADGQVSEHAARTALGVREVEAARSILEERDRALETAREAVERARVAEERALGAEERALGAEERALGAEERALGAEERALVAEERARGAEEISRAAKEIARLADARAAELNAKLEEVSRTKDASSEQVQQKQQAAQGSKTWKRRKNRERKKLEKAETRSQQSQPPGEAIQTGVPTSHNSKPDAAVREQSQSQRSMLGLENEVSSSESEVLLETPRTNVKISEAEKNAVDKGLEKCRELYSRKSSFSEGADLPLADLSGVVAEGRQPLSSAKDAAITSQINQEINKVPTGIEWIVLSKHALEIRQFLSDATYGKAIDKLDKKIKPNLNEIDLSDGRLSKSSFPFSIMMRALLVIILERPNKSDIDDLKWLDRHHIKKFNIESGRFWLKENLESRKAKERLKFLEKAAVKSLGKAGRGLVLIYETCAQTNHRLHPKIDLNKMTSYSKEGTCTSDDEALGEAVRLLAKELKPQP